MAGWLDLADAATENEAGDDPATFLNAAGDAFNSALAANPSKKELDFSSHLKRVTQLTGLSDPVYAEACVMVHSYDVILDVLVINLTQVGELSREVAGEKSRDAPPGRQ